MKGLHHHENYPRFVDIIGSSEKFQGTKILGPNHFFAGVWSTIAIFAKMSVRYGNIFTSLIKTIELGLKFQVSGRKAYLCD